MKRLANLRTWGLALFLTASGLALASCGQQSGEKAAATKGQVVARVGNEVITTQELDNEFRLAGITPDKQKDPEVLKRVLSEIVVRKYLLQQAMNAKLDREPGVLLDLLRVREQVLGNAVLNRAASAKAPTKADVDRYIAKNTWKFADRKLYSVDEVVIPLTPATQNFVNANKDAKSLDELLQKLTTSGIPHGRQLGVLSSSDLPEELVGLIQKRKDDDIFFTRIGSNGLFFKVRAEEARPIEGDAAVNLARQMMRSDALAAELGLAAYSAKLEAKYEGEYADLMKQGEPKSQ
ncbi:SurA N-terminal domain-containing protein [Bradyrhizobium japonicum]|uniref:SurA N-terminal domain-containing protein n=1 Tax=Bradyrhizobium japonicum TaxID=375 RepID=UPI001BA7B44F|nr:SurA N-terminal domain-containing protein [Bradyrhizobium japonicum]MBR0993742.1 SurA N-terminal domain-containing protein [Bradyrhizobium japonicum]